MKITINYFNQVCAELASHANVYNLNAFDEQIKLYQERLAALPPDPKESKFHFFGSKNKEKSERDQCLSRLDNLYARKNETICIINRLKQLKEAANQFVTSELDQHPKKNDGTTEKDMRYYEPISADGLTHAKAIIHQFLESLLVGSIGFASAKQLMSEIDAVLKEREAMQATPKP